MPSISFSTLWACDLLT